MRAVVFASPGEPEVLRIDEVPAPEPGAHELRIRVRAFGVNRADSLQRKGQYPPPPGASPILGLEVAGEVDALGARASRYRVGDKVMALLPGGGYAEQAVVDEGLCLPVPSHTEWPEAAAIPEAFLTADHNLFTLGGAAGAKAALVHAGASGVGTSAIQLLREAQVACWATVGTPEKAALCEKLGARPILYKQSDFAEVVLAATDGRGVDVTLDCIGGAYLERNLQALAKAGRLVVIGLMGGRLGELDMGLLLRKHATILGSTLRPLTLDEKRSVVERFSSRWVSALEKGTIAPIVDSVLPADRAAEAHRRMESNQNAGKIILTW